VILAAIVATIVIMPTLDKERHATRQGDPNTENYGNQ